MKINLLARSEMTKNSSRIKGLAEQILQNSKALLREKWPGITDVEKRRFLHSGLYRSIGEFPGDISRLLDREKSIFIRSSGFKLYITELSYVINDLVKLSSPKQLKPYVDFMLIAIEVLTTYSFQEMGKQPQSAGAKALLTSKKRPSDNDYFQVGKKDYNSGHDPEKLGSKLALAVMTLKTVCDFDKSYHGSFLNFHNLFNDFNDYEENITALLSLVKVSPLFGNIEKTVLTSYGDIGETALEEEILLSLYFRHSTSDWSNVIHGKYIKAGFARRVDELEEKIAIARRSYPAVSSEEAPLLANKESHRKQLFSQGDKAVSSLPPTSPYSGCESSDSSEEESGCEDSSQNDLSK